MNAAKNKGSKLKDNLAVLFFFLMVATAYIAIQSIMKTQNTGGAWDFVRIGGGAAGAIISYIAMSKFGNFGVIWDWLCSLKVNVIILIALAITSIFGTIIPQNAEPGVYIQFAGAEWYEFFKATQLDDMYHSHWFIALLGLLCVTITCCSIDKFPIVWRFVTKPKKDLDDNQVKFNELKETITLKTSVNEAAEQYKTFLTKSVASTYQTEINGSIHLFAQTGIWTRFGVYVTHLSLLIIIIGALVGMRWGDKGYVSIPEFSTANEFYSRKTQTSEKLGFSLRCNGYETTYYENSRQPKEYASEITVIDGGREIFSQTVKVNHTLKYKGFTFYQSNYGAAGNNAFYAILDIVRKSDGKVLAKNSLLYGERKTPLPGTDDMLELVSFKDDTQYGPMAGLKLYKSDGTTDSFWAYPRYKDQEDQRKGDYKFLIDKVKPLQFTGFQVAKDPGVWTVYTGCGLMVLGSLIAFFFSHKRFWIRIDEAGNGKSKVTFSASTNKNKETFERQFAILKERFIKY